MDRKKNILVINHSSAVGGASRSLLITLDALVDDFNITLMTPNGALIDEIKDKGFGCIVYQPPICYWMLGHTFDSQNSRLTPNTVLRLLKLPLELYRFRKKILSLESFFDVIYLNSFTLFPALFVLKRIVGKGNVKVVVHVRERPNTNLPFSIGKKITRMVGVAATDLIAITPNEAFPFEKDFSNKLSILFNIPEYGPLENPRELSNRVVAMACQNKIGKGINEFLKMANILAFKHPDCEFHLYLTKLRLSIYYLIIQKLCQFADPELHFVLKCVPNFRNVELNGKIHIHYGENLRLSDYSLFSVYCRLDKAACPWGRDVIESLSAGVPVIAAGTSDVFVKNGKNGFLLDYPCPNSFAEKVSLLLSDKEKLSFYSRNAIDFSRQNFNNKDFRDKVRKIFLN